MLENIRISFQGIWSHKLRSFLTMLGIIIGIASIISIVSIIRGTNEQIKRDIIGSGSNLVRVQLYQDEYDFVYDPTYEGMPSDIPVVADDTLTSIKELDHVENVSVYNRRMDYNNNLYYAENEFSGAEIYGIGLEYMSISGYRLKRGRLFTAQDYKDFLPVMLIDNNTAKSLFPDGDPLGKIVEYHSTAFQVVGIVEESELYEPAIETIEEYWIYMQGTSSGRIFIPNEVWPIIFSFDEPQEVLVKTDSIESMSLVGKQVADLLNLSNLNTSIKYKSENLLQKAKELQNLSNSANQQLIWIASISLLVGGIGVMNIMLVSVTERTREIGLKKAIGAKKKRILWQFLTEASVLTSIGGILGVIVGIVLAQVVSGITEAPVSISVPSILLSVAFSMAIGIIFGIIPSIKASNLNPIEALRHE